MPELKETIEQLTSAFAEFKKANDERLKQIEANGKADPLLAEKVEKLNAKIDELDKQKDRLDELEMRANRGDIAGVRNGKDAINSAHSEAFAKFMKRGETTGLRDCEVKAGLNTGTNEDGGFAVPVTVDSQIIKLLHPIDPMRELCDVKTIGTGEYKQIVNKGGAVSGWVGETESRDSTAGPKLAEISPYMGELYAQPEATQTMLDDAFFDIEEWLASEVAESFSLSEAAAFVTGNGIKKPRGWLDYPTATTADDTRALGTIQYFKTGVNGAFRALNTETGAGPGDDLLDMVYAMKDGYLPGAVWVARSTTFASIRKLKDADGAYIWQPGIASGEPATILGYPTKKVENMPALGTGSLSVAFGNFKRAYRIVDRIGTRVLRDPFTNKPYIRFYTTKRVGGYLINSEAIKILKFAS